MPIGPGVETWIASGWCLSTCRMILSSGGKATSSWSYLGICQAKTGSKLKMLGLSSTSRRVDVMICRSRPVASAWSPTFWMKRDTPLTSPSVSVNRLTRIGRSSTPGARSTREVSCSKRSRNGRSLF